MKLAVMSEDDILAYIDRFQRADFANDEESSEAFVRIKEYMPEVIMVVQEQLEGFLDPREILRLARERRSAKTKRP